jgi:cell division protein FtsB
MTGLNASAPPRPTAPEPRVRVTLPASRGGLAWLAVLLLIGAFVTFQVGRQVYASWSIGREADSYRAQIAAAQAQTEHLQAILDYLNSDAYISQQARRLLNLGDPGERVLIIPPGAEAPPPATVNKAPPAPPPLLEQWLDLFFGS